MVIDELIELLNKAKTDGKSIAQIARDIGFSDVYLGKIIKGKTIPGISNAEKILKYFNKELTIK
jgi:hypothetical protein